MLPKVWTKSSLAQNRDFDVSSDVSVDEWQVIADQCDYATFFHTPAWFAAFSETYPYFKITAKKFNFADGKVALFPLLELRAPRNSHHSYLSGPAGCYGGLISADELHREHVIVICDWILLNFQTLNWRLNPLDESASLLDPHITATDTTEMLHLGKFQNEAQLLKNYKRSVRKEINKAIKSGFTVKAAENWSEWEEYFVLYQTALQRWGDKASSNYPINFFENLYSSNNAKLKLWLVFDQDKIIGGNLNFYHNKHCVEWHAAFDSKFFGTGARNFLVDRIIADALLHGYSFYDFNPSGGHEGTRKFKQAFGTIQMVSNVISLNKMSYTAKLFQILNKLIR